MFRNGLFYYCLLTVLLFHPLILLSVDSPVENNSIEFSKKMTDEIIKNPSDDHVLNYAAKLLNLAPYTGRKKIISAFDDALKKNQEKSHKEIINAQVLRLLTDELEGNYVHSIKNFSVITRWNVSEPWTGYGLPSYYQEFQPEKAFKIENIEKGKNFLTDGSGEIFPFKISHYAGETAYMTCSFTCEEGIILWIVSDAKYRLIINGKGLQDNETSGKKEIKAYSLKGAKAYTIQIKIMAVSGTHHPCLRAMITDEKNLPVKINYSSAIFNYSYTAEKLYSLHESEIKDNCEASVLTDEMNGFLMSGNFYDACKLGASITGKYPAYAPAYNKYIYLLDIMNRDDEYLKTVERFRKIFPDSDVHLNWLADFYMSRDMAGFLQIMQTMPSWHASEQAAESYLYTLCGQKKYSEALTFSSSLKKYPTIKLLIPGVIKESGDIESWRKALFGGITGRDEADYYYDLGIAEMLMGIDPVMYWKKAFSMKKNTGLLRDLSDIYENSIVKSNEYYKGIYTDLHPEFLWYSKKRKISLYVFESGKVFFEGEDIIPSGRKIRKMKYSESGLEFSGHEIRTAIPSISGLKVLYVLSAADGLPSVTDFKTEIPADGGFTVKYKVTGKEEFSVVKYSGEFTGDKKNIFMLAEGLILKSENEKISDLEYEVVFQGDNIPVVNYKGSSLTPGKSDNGLTKYVSKERFSDDDIGSIISDIFRFSSDAVFSQWYAGIISGMSRYKNVNINVSGKNNTKEFIEHLHFQIMTRVLKNGEINFNPDNPGSVLLKGRGTVEERSHLAKIILEKNGIKSFISFTKDKKGFPRKILLYVPERKGKGFWLDFYGENPADKTETGDEAIIITAEGYEKIPVNRDAYIR